LPLDNAGMTQGGCIKNAGAVPLVPAGFAGFAGVPRMRHPGVTLDKSLRLLVSQT